MLLDQISLLTAIGFSSVALILTLCISWMGSRRDSFLLSWSVGLVLVVAGVVAYGMTVESYNEWSHVTSFVLTLLGFAAIYVGALQFRSKPLNLLSVAALTGGLIALTTVPFLFGASALGTALANLGMGFLMGMSGYQYWSGRDEARVPMTANAVLYGIAAISFFLCAGMSIYEPWHLTKRPENWAEEANAIIMIIGLTGIGAISLALNQSRWTRLHRAEAQTDSLSGLLNRRALFDRFGTEPTAGMAVLMFDIDHFKQINDKRGHAAGDAVIQHFSNILKQHLRDSDTAARLGGEEFCAILPPLPMEQARVIAERVRSAFELSPTRLVPEVIGATVSVGLAICGPAEPFSSVLNRADDALYKAKNNGRNRVNMAPAVRLIA